VAAGDGLSSAQRLQIDKAIRDAETSSRHEFSVYVGRAEGDPRGYAERLHASLVNPARTVMILVDPAQRAVEVVTGAEVRRSLTDDEVGLAIAEMTSLFQHDDLVAGVVRGICLLAAHAERPRTLHQHQP
jgi:uncharacterized membrane protein YgcG